MNNQKFVAELAKLRSSATFLSIMGYRNEYSEIADYSIVFHFSYENALKRSLVALESVIPSSDMESVAKQELIAGFRKSLAKIAETPIEVLEDGYTRFFDDDGNYIKGVKLHDSTNTLHIYGLVNHKRILMPGNYPKSNKRLLTIAKDKLRKLCPVSKFRQFRIVPNQVDRISVENLSLLPPSN